MALCLTRRLGESFVIGDGVSCPLITVTVTEIVYGKVKLAITAPREVPIARTELLRDRAAVACSICRDPNCDNPGGKH